MKWLAILGVILLLMFLATWVRFAAQWSAYQETHHDTHERKRP
jgi:hypothetical protein